MSQRPFVKTSRKSKPRLSRQAAIARMGELRGNIRTHNTQFSKAEKKNIDTSAALFVVAQATGTVTLLNGCAAGGLPTNRVGRRTLMTSVFFRATYRMASTGAGASPLRFMIVYDKQPNKSAMVATDVLTVDNIGGLNLLANSDRFKVIRDILIPCIGTAGPQSIVINEYVKLPGLRTDYVDGTGAGTVADITTGALYLLQWQDGGLITVAPSTAGYLRVRFTDL